MRLVVDMLDLLLAGDGEKVVLDRDFQSFSSRQLDVHGVGLAVRLLFRARHVLERAEDPWLRGGVSDQVNGHLRTQRPKHRSRSVNGMVVAFLVLEATLALRIRNAKGPME